MRPGDFSPGNLREPAVDCYSLAPASMRPGDFSPGNRLGDAQAAAAGGASMRPGDFSPGNDERHPGRDHAAATASMRPGDFSPGNPPLPT